VPLYYYLIDTRSAAFNKICGICYETQTLKYLYRKTQVFSVEICVQEYHPTEPWRQKYPPCKRLLCIRLTFSESVIVSTGVSTLGSTESYSLSSVQKLVVRIRTAMTSYSVRTFRQRHPFHSWRNHRGRTGQQKHFLRTAYTTKYGRH